MPYLRFTFNKYNERATQISDPESIIELRQAILELCHEIQDNRTVSKRMRSDQESLSR